MKKRNYYQGILPAMQCPMKTNGKIDENELIRFTKWLASDKGVEGLVTNGHTGEIFSLTRSERVSKYNQLIRIEEDLGSKAKMNKIRK